MQTNLEQLWEKWLQAKQLLKAVVAKIITVSAVSQKKLVNENLCGWLPQTFYRPDALPSYCKTNRGNALKRYHCNKK